MWLRTWGVIMILTLSALPKQALLARTSTPRLPSYAFIAGPVKAPWRPARKSQSVCQPMRSFMPPPSLPVLKHPAAAGGHATRAPLLFSALRMDAGGEQEEASHFFASLISNRPDGTPRVNATLRARFLCACPSVSSAVLISAAKANTTIE